jgi:type I restriction enzyme M protein
MKNIMVDEANFKIFNFLKDKWVTLQPEERVRQGYIVRLMNRYGYSLEQMAQEVSVSGTSRGAGRARADIVVWRNKKEQLDKCSPFIVVECKAGKEVLRQEDYYQGLNYAAMVNTQFLVITNNKETACFKVIHDTMPKQLKPIADIPPANHAFNEEAIQELVLQQKRLNLEEFHRLLFRCHSIIRDNDKFSPEVAFDEISKIFFMKMMYEKSSTDESVFTLSHFKEQEKFYEETTRPVRKNDLGAKGDVPFLHFLFEKTKQEFDTDQLFDVNETIRMKQPSFEDIVAKLEKYNLSRTPDDVKGITFEKFLGKTFRGELGQYFTPRTIVDFMVDVLDPQEEELICDPCCGSGGFLIKSFQHVREKIDKSYERTFANSMNQIITDGFDDFIRHNPVSHLNELNRFHLEHSGSPVSKNYGDRLHYLSHKCIFGVDANPRMARVAKMNMIMHGDGHNSIFHHDGLLDVVGVYENRFDVVLTNPPFGSRVGKNLIINESDLIHKTYVDGCSSPEIEYCEAFQRLKANIGKPIVDLYDLGKSCRLTEVLFLERCLRLLKPGGRLGIVLPEGIMNSASFEKVRRYFEERAKILLLVSLPRDVFLSSGASVKTGLVFLKKFTEQEAGEFNHLKQSIAQSVRKTFADSIDAIDNRLQDAIHVRDIKKKSLLGFKKVKNTGLPLADKDRQIHAMENELKSLNQNIKEARKIHKKEMAKINKKIDSQIDTQLKNRFDYTLPLVNVKHAGISSTGGAAENRLIEIAKEFKEYRIKNRLWREKNCAAPYDLVPCDITQYRIDNKYNPSKHDVTGA